MPDIVRHFFVKLFFLQELNKIKFFVSKSKFAQLASKIYAY